MAPLKVACRKAIFIPGQNDTGSLYIDRHAAIPDFLGRWQKNGHAAIGWQFFAIHAQGIAALAALGVFLGSFFIVNPSSCRKTSWHAICLTV